MKGRPKKSDICIIGIPEEENKWNRRYIQIWNRKKLVLFRNI